MTTHVPTRADREVLECLNQRRSFSVVAGAGSGKTTSLVEALKELL
jgi:DNA helicase-2/ATP-dependent DNA helicase PcrA